MESIENDDFRESVAQQDTLGGSMMAPNQGVLTEPGYGTGSDYEQAPAHNSTLVKDKHHNLLE